MEAKLWDARDKWEEVGLALGIDHATLETIRQDKAKVDRCFREVLREWFNVRGSKTCSVIANALCKQNVRMENVADNCCVHT